MTIKIGTGKHICQMYSSSDDCCMKNIGCEDDGSCDNDALFASVKEFRYGLQTTPCKRPLLLIHLYIVVLAAFFVPGFICSLLTCANVQVFKSPKSLGKLFIRNRRSIRTTSGGAFAGKGQCKLDGRDVEPTSGALQSHFFGALGRGVEDAP